MTIDEIIAIVKDAGNILLTAKRPKIMEKSGHANFVTETDEKVQRFLVEKLKAVLPEAEFLGEEDGQDVFSSKMASGYCFVIDPIDGTSNFIYEYRPSVISVGLRGSSAYRQGSRMQRNRHRRKSTLIHRCFICALYGKRRKRNTGVFQIRTCEVI